MPEIAPAGHGTLPNLFIVGQPKSGTSALFSFLKQHPEVSACQVKEPQYFCKDLQSQHFALSKTERTDENYLKLFEETPASYQMDGSTAYLYSQQAASEIRAFNPDAKIIVMLREPVDFLYTYHKQLLRNSCKFEDVTDFQTALSLESERRQGRKLPKGVFDKKFLWYSERVKYVEHLTRFEECFPPENILVIIYDDFRRDNAGVFQRVLRFLDLPEFNAEFSQVNQQVNVRNRRLKQFLDRTLFPLKTRIKRYAPRSLFVKLRSGYRSLVFKKGEIEKLDDNVRQQLKKHYYSQVALLSEKLGRDLLSEWGYDAPETGR